MSSRIRHAAGRAGHPLSTWVNLVLIAFAFGLSYLTFRFYENPIRQPAR